MWALACSLPNPQTLSGLAPEGDLTDDVIRLPRKKLTFRSGVAKTELRMDEGLGRDAHVSVEAHITPKSQVRYSLNY